MSIEDIEERIDNKMTQHAEILAAIQEIEDFEEQGYATGPIIADATYLSPGELLIQMLTTTRQSDSRVDLERTIGVIRWCLDNRA
jgi:hypothetical protein